MISKLLSLSPVILKPKKKKSVTTSAFSFSICHEVVKMPIELKILKALLPDSNSERDGNTRSPDLPLEKPICRPEINS